MIPEKSEANAGRVVTASDDATKKEIATVSETSSNGQRETYLMMGEYTHPAGASFSHIRKHESRPPVTRLFLEQ